MVIIFFYTTLFLYAIHIILFIIGFLKIEVYKDDEMVLKNKKYLTVIIPFKNEEQNIEQVYINLKNQTLDVKYFDIIFINDNSTDKSEEKLSRLIDNKANFKLISLNKTVNGKKNAIETGVKNSNSELIVTTDADCFHQIEWLKTILNFYIKFRPKMIIAPVIMVDNSFFERMQALEFSSLMTSTAGAVGINRPIMCNGANLIYEKKIFTEFSDAMNKKEVSGDDIFFMHNVKTKYKNDIMFLKSKKAIVFTDSEKSLKLFMRQRLRWASKSKSYKDIDTITSSVLVFSSNLFIVLLLAMSIYKVDNLVFFVSFFLIKFIVDFALIITSAKFNKQYKNLITYPFLSLIYPFYISITAITSLIYKSVSWKTNDV